MQINTEILKNGRGSIKLTIEASDYREAVNNELKNLRRKAQIKGFRAGMVPMGMVKKMYGKSVFAEQLNKALEKALNDFMQDTDWDILANPILMENDMEKMDINGTKDYSFTFEVALKPDIEVALLNDTETVFPHYEISVGDDLLDDEIERLQKQHGTQEEEENDIEENDSLEVTFAELDEEGNVKEEGVSYTTWISADMLKEEGPQESLLALKKGEHLDVEIFEAFDREKEQVQKIVLGLTANEEGEFPETSGSFRMTIDMVKRLRKAAIDRELYMTVFGLKEDTVEEAGEDGETAVVNPSNDIPEEVTPEFFREKIKESLSKQYNLRTGQRLWTEFKKHIDENTEVELAEDIIRSMWYHNNGANKEIEDKEAAYKAHFEDLRWGVILEKLASHFEVEVENDDIVMETIAEVSNMVRMYMGGQNVPDDLMKQLVESRLKDEEYVRSAGRRVTEAKVNTKLMEVCALNTETMSFDEYNEMLEKENAALMESAGNDEAAVEEEKRTVVEENTEAVEEETVVVAEENAEDTVVADKEES